MRRLDLFKLVQREYRFEKAESVVSILVQSLVYFLTLLLFSISHVLDEIFDHFLVKYYKDGFAFNIGGFDEGDRNLLLSMGFYEIHFDGTAYAKRSSLRNIWYYKILSLLRGKDIWSFDLEEAMNTLLFFKILFIALGFFLLLLLINNISNSVFMKLNRRCHYIEMLNCVGYPSVLCRRIFGYFFLFRYLLSFIIAIFLYFYGIKAFNVFVEKNFHIPPCVEFKSLQIISAFAVCALLILQNTYNKAWRSLSD